MGLLNDVSLWPWMMGRKSVAVPDEDVVEEAVRMFLHHYGRRHRGGIEVGLRTANP
jgi:TetR/AcrR family transcriptional regulator of autoinduction and epiphytic fitness